MLSDLAVKLSKVIGEKNDYGVSLDKSEICKKAESFLKYHSLSELLPYESYDEATKLYFNRSSVGFVLSAPLFVGSEDSFENGLEEIFKNILPAGSNLQFLLFAWPKVDSCLNQWFFARQSAPSIIREMAAERANYFRRLCKDSEEKEGKEGKKGKLPKIRIFEGLISFSIDRKYLSSSFVESDIKDLAEKIQTVFAARGARADLVDPSYLIKLLNAWLNYDLGSLDYPKRKWNKYQSISNQVIEPNSHFELFDNKLVLNKTHAEYRCYSVRNYPSIWKLSNMSKLLGSATNDFLQVGSPFFLHFGVHVIDSSFKKSAMLTKASRVESQAASTLGKLIPALRREAAEWDYVRQQLERNQRLVKTSFQVMLIASPDTIKREEQNLGNLFLANEWELQRDNYIMLHSLLAMLPMSWGDGMLENNHFFNKLRTSLSYEPVNLLPIQGEFCGGEKPGMLLAGRRGQLGYWFPFDQTMGNTNYNVSVVGRSGSGKSVFMQELATSILGVNGKVYVLDVGRSFAKQAKLFEGQFIEFSVNSQLCLNPFTSINCDTLETIQDGLSLLQPVIGMMAAPKAGTSDYEDRLIAKALNEVWLAKGKEAGIDDVANWFLSQNNQKSDTETCQRIGTMLYPYSKRGAYGKFFNGPANIDFGSHFVVVELEELKSRPDLQQVVVQILMTVITNNVILGGRKNYSGIIFDEAWELLGGAHTGKFIERCARTLRKYEGALVVGTQTLDDFYSSEGAKAAFANSDWVCMFSQKPESIARFAKDNKMAISEYDRKLLETVKTLPGQYAEMAIMTNGKNMVQRLLLDPFSLVLYSTKPQEYRRVEELHNYGLSLTEAIKQVAGENYGYREE